MAQFKKSGTKFRWEVDRKLRAFWGSRKGQHQDFNQATVIALTRAQEFDWDFKKGLQLYRLNLAVRQEFHRLADEHAKYVAWPKDQPGGNPWTPIFIKYLKWSKR